MSDILERLKAHRVKVTPVEVKDLGTLHFRDPSGTDWVRIQQLLKVLAGAGAKEAPAYMIVPLLMCDESGELAFPDYDKGIEELSKIKGGVLKQIVDACLEATGVGALLSSGVETAEKNSSASPNSASLIASPLN